LRSDVTLIDGTAAKITGLIKLSHCCDDTQNIDLALREALANAIVHGNGSNPAKLVRICLAVQEDCGILIIVKDAGLGFEPSQLPNPVVGQNLLAEHGRGIFLINRLMDDVRFSFKRGTSIYMRRNRVARKGA
jgi:serine/threonine-protein kinase RsbW